MSACGSCGGSGTVQVEIYNTETGEFRTITQLCLACMGSGSS